MAAPGQYREGLAARPPNRVLHGAFERLEPCDGRPSCTVLRGEERSNALLLIGAWVRGARFAKFRAIMRLAFLRYIEK